MPQNLIILMLLKVPQRKWHPNCDQSLANPSSTANGTTPKAQCHRAIPATVLRPQTTHHFAFCPTNGHCAFAVDGTKCAKVVPCPKYTHKRIHFGLFCSQSIWPEKLKFKDVFGIRLICPRCVFSLSHLVVLIVANPKWATTPNWPKQHVVK